MFALNNAFGVKDFGDLNKREHDGRYSTTTGRPCKAPEKAETDENLSTLVRFHMFTSLDVKLVRGYGAGLLAPGGMR